jgi:hypothetical protein
LLTQRDLGGDDPFVPPPRRQHHAISQLRNSL